MKAVILAAGKSTRLGALGAQLPKPMLLLHNRPVLEWTIDRLRHSGITDLIINLHHAPEVIFEHFGDGSRYGVSIEYSRENQILGTAGALRRVGHMLEGGTFLVVYGDTVLDWDPRPMIQNHLEAAAAATIVVAQVPDASRLGVVCFDHDWSIKRFVEKPGFRPELGRFVSAGLCVLEPCVLEHIPKNAFCDLGAHVFPALVNAGLKLRAYPRPEPLLLLDTPEQYSWAQQYWEPQPRN